MNYNPKYQDDREFGNLVNEMVKDNPYTMEGDNYYNQTKQRAYSNNAPANSVNRYQNNPYINFNQTTAVNTNSSNNPYQDLVPKSHIGDKYGWGVTDFLQGLANTRNNLRNDALLRENQQKQRDMLNAQREFKYGVDKDNRDRALKMQDYQRKLNYDNERLRNQRMGIDLSTNLPNYDDYDEENQQTIYNNWINSGELPNGVNKRNKTVFGVSGESVLGTGIFGTEKTPNYSTNTTPTQNNYNDFFIDSSDYYSDETPSYTQNYTQDYAQNDNPYGDEWVKVVNDNGEVAYMNKNTKEIRQ